MGSPTHTGDLAAVALSPDGLHLVTTCHDGYYACWHTPTAKRVAPSGCCRAAVDGSLGHLGYVAFTGPVAVVASATLLLFVEGATGAVIASVDTRA